MPDVDVQDYAVLFSKVTQDCLFLCGGRVLPQRPYRAVGVAANKIVREKFNHERGDHIEEFLNTNIFLLKCLRYDFSCHRNFLSIFFVNK